MGWNKLNAGSKYVDIKLELIPWSSLTKQNKKICQHWIQTQMEITIENYLTSIWKNYIRIRQSPHQSKTVICERCSGSGKRNFVNNLKKPPEVNRCSYKQERIHAAGVQNVKTGINRDVH